MNDQSIQVPMELTQVEQAIEDSQNDLSRAKTNLHTLNDLKEWICEESWLEEVTAVQRTINSLQDKLSGLRRGLVDQSVVRSLDF